MRRIFIAMIAGGFLLLSGVVASAKLDAGTSGDKSQNGQQQTQTQNDQKGQPAAKPATTPATKPATKPASKPAATTAECGETGDNPGNHEHEDLACNDQNEQAGVNESKTANDKAETNGNNED